jgi:hypothetical protein
VAQPRDCWRRNGVFDRLLATFDARLPSAVRVFFGNKKTGHEARFLSVRFGLDSLDVTRLLFSLVARGNLEGNLLTFLQGFESLHVNSREMGEKIFAAAVRSNEAETFRIVEPLYGTCFHVTFL